MVVFRTVTSDFATLTRQTPHSALKAASQPTGICDEGVSKTHVAFLGTAMLAKGMNRCADLFAIKPEHAENNPNAFSARTLCHSVLVPLAAELGINLGVHRLSSAFSKAASMSAGAFPNNSVNRSISSTGADRIFSFAPTSETSISLNLPESFLRFA
jgi:SacI restriction endonuclease